MLVQGLDYFFKSNFRYLRRNIKNNKDLIIFLSYVNEFEENISIINYQDFMNQMLCLYQTYIN